MPNRCTQDHNDELRWEQLPPYQGSSGRHKCAACAYYAGYEEGVSRSETLNLNLDNLPENQGGTARHKSPQAAYALGYYEGVMQSHNE